MGAVRGVRLAAVVATALLARGAGHAAVRGAGALVVVPLLLQACVFVPRTTESFDAQCNIVTRHMDLQPVQIASVGNCSNDCGAVLVVIGATAAASAVVSGSVVVIGNTVYWLEKQRRCQRSDRDRNSPDAPPASARGAA